MSTEQHPLKIGIVGAGPVSLAFANMLQKSNLPFTVFESSSSFRASGGSLDLHPQSGQLALKEAGLWQAFMDNSRPESECHKIVNLDGQVLFDENKMTRPQLSDEEKFAGRPEIDRKLLMKMLFENLETDKVLFGKRLEKVEPSSGSEKYTLYFEDGSQDTDFDLVVGGDGAWSKVRPLLTTTNPQYSGVSMVEVWCEDVESNPWLHDYVGAGSLFGFGQDRSVIAQMQGDGSLRTYACLRSPENFLETCGIDWNNTENARKELIERYFSHIGDDLKRVVLECKDSLTPRPMYELPIGLTWSHQAGVTLIGDAAHLMTPFAGVGVNVGLTDSLSLARQVIKASRGEITLDEALKLYEMDMFPRARKNAEKTVWGKRNHLSKNGAQEFVDKAKGHR